MSPALNDPRQFGYIFPEDAARLGLTRRHRVAPPGFLPPAARSLGALAACPDFAPYELPGGSCSNVPPGVDAHELYTSGLYDYETDEAGVVTSIEPFQPPAPLNPSPAYIEAGEDTYEEILAKQREAAAAGAACEIRQNCSPSAVGGNPGAMACLYWLACRYPDGYMRTGLYDPETLVDAGDYSAVPGSPTYQRQPGDVYVAPQPVISAPPPAPALPLPSPSTAVTVSPRPRTTQPAAAPSSTPPASTPQQQITQASFQPAYQQPAYAQPPATQQPAAIAQSPAQAGAPIVIYQSRPGGQQSQLEVIGAPPPGGTQILPASTDPDELLRWAKQLPTWVWLAAAAAAGTYALKGKRR